ALLTARKEHQEMLDKITRLQQYEIELSQKIHRYETAIAPVKMLPPEVLRRVFTFCISDSIVIPVVRTDNRFVISHVCSYWRHIALSSHQLWDDICI
ncbi:hypothetical protein AMATHDRAFT_115116, partial [Amanita thiersii Skay4041]